MPFPNVTTSAAGTHSNPGHVPATTPETTSPMPDNEGASRNKEGGGYRGPHDTASQTSKLRNAYHASSEDTSSEYSFSEYGSSEEEEEEEEEESRPLSVEDLIAIPDDMREKLSRLKYGSPEEISGLIREIDRALERIMVKRSIDRKFQSQHIANANQESQNVVTPRYPKLNLKMAKHSAIPNPAYSHGTEAPQFLHANYLNFGKGCEFIVSQKPMREEIEGVWKMLMNEKVPLIVDLTEFGEFQKDKNEPEYTPRKDKPLQFGGRLSITCKENEEGKKECLTDSTEDSENAWIEVSELIINDGADSHSLIRVHFSWPDEKSIAPNVFIALGDKIEMLNPESRPVFVHCESGYGRSGSVASFVAARNRIRNEIADGNPCTVGKSIDKMMTVMGEGRIGRGPLFVQTHAQFYGVLNALFENFKEQIQKDERKNAPVEGLPNP